MVRVGEDTHRGVSRERMYDEVQSLECVQVTARVASREQRSRHLW